MTHETPIRIDHVGIAVEEFETAETVLHALGAEKYVDDTGPDGEFRWVGYVLGDASRLELITPLVAGSFLDEFLDRNGPGLHHVTCEVADIDAVAASLTDAGVTVVDRAEHEVYTELFVSPHNPTGTLFQLMEYHDTYEERYDPDHSFVGGHRVEEAWPAFDSAEE
ncbi:VOC family protein [Halococcus saccharolyticus]|nr:VOC family protein [Halococcus saccharolyticus]